MCLRCHSSQALLDLAAPMQLLKPLWAVFPPVLLSRPIHLNASPQYLKQSYQVKQKPVKSPIVQNIPFGLCS